MNGKSKFYLNELSRFRFKNVKYSTFLSEILFLLGVIISITILKYLSLGTLVAGPRQTNLTNCLSFGSFSSLFDQNEEKTLF